MNRENLKKLADYLAQPKIKTEFDMSEFGQRPMQYGKKSKAYADWLIFVDLADWPCATVACALGSGPHAGIPILPTDLSWWSYGERAFQMESQHGNNDEWEWCFSEEWAATDNTRSGAALRIYWLLDRGLPEDWRRQLYGRAPLCYEVAL